MIWVFIALAVLLGIWAFVHYRSNKKPSVSNDTNLAIIKYENFGHNFSIADLVNTELKKLERPEYTSWEWETFDYETKKTNEKRLRIKLISLLDTEKKVSNAISLEQSSDYWIETSYSDAYIRRDGMISSRVSHNPRPVKEVVKDDLVDTAQRLIIKFKTDYKDTEFGSDLRGMV
jgi:hypothetical protein